MTPIYVPDDHRSDAARDHLLMTGGLLIARCIQLFRSPAFVIAHASRLDHDWRDRWRDTRPGIPPRERVHRAR